MPDARGFPTPDERRKAEEVALCYRQRRSQLEAEEYERRRAAERSRVAREWRSSITQAHRRFEFVIHPDRTDGKGRSRT